jgi:hypothetical protein
MIEERAGAWTRTSRVIRARPEELYAAFLNLVQPYETGSRGTIGFRLFPGLGKRRPEGHGIRVRCACHQLPDAP